MSKRAETKAETRQALIRAGMALFAERGLDAPSLDEICERAGFTRGAFYVHFEDRDDFVVAVMDQVGSSFLKAVLEATAGEQSLAATAQRFLASIESGQYPLMGKSGLRFHQLLTACARSPAIRERYVALVQQSEGLVARLFDEGQKSGLVRADLRSRDAARLLLALVIGVQTMIDLGVEIDVSRAAGVVLGLLSGSSQPSK
jgi:AcrR family transcriptional regulator